MENFGGSGRRTGHSIGGGSSVAQGTPLPPKFLRFHGVFGENWPNIGLRPPPFGLGAPSGCSWIRCEKNISISPPHLGQSFEARILFMLIIMRTITCVLRSWLSGEVAMLNLHTNRCIYSVAIACYEYFLPLTVQINFTIYGGWIVPKWSLWAKGRCVNPALINRI